MIARVTLAEIDSVRLKVEDAVELFKESVVPALREQEGYEGAYVLTTEEGKALVLTFWADEEAAEASVASGHYSEQLEKFVTFFRSPPGRETYRVVVAEAPTAAIARNLR
jgi:heme-degrading monooxygenase HmoA